MGIRRSTPAVLFSSQPRAHPHPSYLDAGKITVTGPVGPYDLVCAARLRRSLYLDPLPWISVVTPGVIGDGTLLSPANTLSQEREELKWGRSPFRSMLRSRSIGPTVTLLRLSIAASPYLLPGAVDSWRFRQHSRLLRHDRWSRRSVQLRVDAALGSFTVPVRSSLPCPQAIWTPR